MAMTSVGEVGGWIRVRRGSGHRRVTLHEYAHTCTLGHGIKIRCAIYSSSGSPNIEMPFRRKDVLILIR